MVLLRRERGLTASGGMPRHLAWLGRLIVQCGITIGLTKLMLMFVATGLIIAGMRFLKRISNSNSNGNTHYIDSNSGNTYYSDSGWHDGSRHSHRANRGEEARQEDRHDDGWGGEGGGDGGGGGD